MQQDASIRHAVLSRLDPGLDRCACARCRPFLACATRACVRACAATWRNRTWRPPSSWHSTTRSSPFARCAALAACPLFVEREGVRGAGQAAISLLGRLSSRNPAVILPALRRTLIQLLCELKVSQPAGARVPPPPVAQTAVLVVQQFGASTLDLEQSAKLLGHLLVSARTLIRPYVAPMLDVLVPRLKE